MFRGEDRFFPLVFSLTAQAVTTEDVDTMRAFYEDVHARHERFVHLVDGRRTARPEPAVQQLITQLTRDVLGETRVLQVANAIVVDDWLAASTMTALRWIVPAPVPERYTTTVTEAMRWLLLHAQEAGLVIGEEARDFAVRLEVDRDRVFATSGLPH